MRTNLTIRDPETGEPVEDGVMGEIVAVGPQVCDGYWGLRELSAELYRDYGLRSGDLGVLWEGELYVTGRRKDLLIVRGRNHYPQDIEQTMDSADPEVRHGCGVAVSVPSDTGERLVLIQEVEAHFSRDPQVIVENIRRSVCSSTTESPRIPSSSRARGWSPRPRSREAHAVRGERGLSGRQDARGARMVSHGMTTALANSCSGRRRPSRGGGRLPLAGPTGPCS